MDTLSSSGSACIWCGGMAKVQIRIQTKPPTVIRLPVGFFIGGFMAVFLVIVFYALAAGIVFGVLDQKNPGLKCFECCFFPALVWPITVPAICGFLFAKWFLKRFS